MCQLGYIQRLFFALDLLSHRKRRMEFAVMRKPAAVRKPMRTNVVQERNCCNVLRHNEMSYMAWREGTGIGARGVSNPPNGGFVIPRGISLNQKNHSSQAVRCTTTSYVTTGERLTSAEIRKRQMKKSTGRRPWRSHEYRYQNG
jgi:hypothetical protein